MIWPSPRAWIHHPQWLAISMAGMKKIYQFLWFITLPTPTKLHPGAWIFCSLRSVRRACSRACWALSWKKGYGATVDISWTKSSKGKSVYSCLVLHSECHECPLATVDLQPLPEMMLLKDSNNIKELERDYLGQKGPKECATTCNHKPVSFTNYVWCLLQIIDSLCLRICAPENSMVPHNYVLAGQAACCLPPLSNPRGAPVFQAAGPNGFYWINVYIYIYIIPRWLLNGTLWSSPSWMHETLKYITRSHWSGSKLVWTTRCFQFLIHKSAKFWPTPSTLEKSTFLQQSNITIEHPNCLSSIEKWWFSMDGFSISVLSHLLSSFDGGLLLFFSMFASASEAKFALFDWPSKDPILRLALVTILKLNKW